ncbi:hypothetical protein TNCT_406501 [Trichonephila clavata]|uniref:Sodium/hydrogen exchanger 8 n=1 Tax=Trichonephila clavata TaxID=2740835 RepID=A0A8X6KG69_TRICU|nr:hypothetical protein TNCT_406501 [Trichonephila clavata]
MPLSVLKDIASSVAEIESNLSLLVVRSNVTQISESSSVSECADRLTLPVKGTYEEVNHSLKILLMLFVIGAAVGGSFAITYGHLPGDFEKREAFDPTTFFLFMLPPIMYESAYNLHKGNFFRNIGSILVFAIFGTAVSAFIIGGILFLFGKKQWVYELSFTESFAFGSFISAVDPVATLAVFHALDVDPVLNMLVTGESILNDAVAIVLSR